MVTVNLSENERTLLKVILEEDLSDLSMEIAHTDRLDYRNKLKERKRVISKTIEALGDTDR